MTILIYEIVFLLVSLILRFFDIAVLFTSILSFVLCLIIPHTYLCHKNKLIMSILLNVVLFLILSVFMIIVANNCHYNCAGEGLILVFGIFILSMIINSIALKINDYLIKKRIIKHENYIT